MFLDITIPLICALDGERQLQTESGDPVLSHQASPEDHQVRPLAEGSPELL